MQEGPEISRKINDFTYLIHFHTHWAKIFRESKTLSKEIVSRNSSFSATLCDELTKCFS